MQLIKLLFFVVIDFVLAYEYDSGFPAGYLSDCPGMNRTTKFSPRTSQSLSVVVFWPNSGYLDRGHQKCKLSKAGVACAAKRINFHETTKVMISGYLDTSYSPFVRTYARQAVEEGYSVIMLEIFPVLFRSYPIAARVTKPLGVRLGEFLARLSQRGLSPDRLEILGGSLGAHIAYYASIKYYELTGQRPWRLTGLDPAGPCFRNLPRGERFSPDGARHVDALHTNIDGFGMAEPIGHVDFYAAGGEYQPSMVGDFILPCFTLCSHVRAGFIWMSVNQYPDKFIGVRCKNLEKARRGDCYEDEFVINFLGPNTNFTREGIYYLPTTATSPYYKDKEGLIKPKNGINEFLANSSPDADLIL